MASANQEPAIPSINGTVPLVPTSAQRVNRIRRSSTNFPPHSGQENHPRRLSLESLKSNAIVTSNTVAIQSKALERQTNDAALKRAMLGREQAEGEARRNREEIRLLKKQLDEEAKLLKRHVEEARGLRKQVEEGHIRERRVSERLEGVMVTYSRAKDAHAHTQALWEKEIRTTKKELFKSQSLTVKLQEELKAARLSRQSSAADLGQEKERSKRYEEEAFTAKYQLVGLQTELANMMEKMKLIEQEREEFKMIAKNEEVARIAAEAQIPMAVSKHEEESASPEIALSPTSSEEDVEQLRRKFEWEKRRGDKAQDHVEFLQLECRLRICSCCQVEKQRLA